MRQSLNNVVIFKCNSKELQQFQVNKNDSDPSDDADIGFGTDTPDPDNWSAME